MLTVNEITEHLTLEIVEDDVQLTMQIDDSSPAGVVISGAADNLIEMLPDGLYARPELENTPAARAKLGLGTAATRDVTITSSDTTAGRLLKVGDFGVGGRSSLPFTQESGFFADSVVRPHLTNGAGFQSAYARERRAQLWMNGGGVLIGRFSISSDANDTETPWRTFLSSGNTTVDSNGFIKTASPIIKLHKDRIEAGEKAAGALFTRIGPGHYEISNCNGLRLNDGWYLETPQDRNGNKYLNIEWHQAVEPDSDDGVLEEPADITLTIRCYERVWNPQTGLYDNGEPVDVPDGRWIDLRMNEVRTEEPELIDEE